MGFERHYSAWIIASVITVASFVGATVYTQNRLTRLDALSSMIETNAVPSIRYLSRAAVRLTRLNQLMDDVATSTPRRAAALAATRQEVTALNQEVDEYLRLPTLPGERELWTALRADVNRALLLVEAVADEVPDQATSEGQTRADQVDEALDSAVRSVLATLDFDVRQSEALARDVRRVRATTLRMIIELDALATVIALVAVLFAYRATRRHDQLVAEHNTLLTLRVTELDRFAGRVAHDVLSPLGTVATSLSLLERLYDERARTYIERSQRALHRVKQLVDDLLTFARAGARPDPASHCSMDAVLTSIITDYSERSAKKGIELVLEQAQPMQVRCAPGVITSIGQNLIRNAIKYIGDAPIKRITVRISASSGEFARLEVEDTGPGIPPEIRSTLFEPFVRGPHERASGTGLGLATVKRLVESHGGSVGVESKAIGSLFWVELPRVAADSPHTSPAIEPQRV